MARVFTITEGLENLGALRSGGQGSVYKARRGNIISAVKILPTPIHSEDDNDKNYQDFQNEVSKLKKVNEKPNPNVVRILSSGITESGALPFIEMEFIDGPDLEDLLKPPLDTVFTIHEAVKVAVQLSGALAHCHKVGVKHGDIKSNNVKFNIHSGNYILLDFGLAVMSDEQRRTSLRHAGAVEFMAPEQNEGEMHLESDVYSFGIILYELLAGVVPFPLSGKGETSRNTIMLSHMEQPVPDILDLRRKNLPASWEEERKDFEMLVPAWLFEIIAKCVKKLPENRYRNGLELHEAIIKENTSFAGSYLYDSSESAVLQRENQRLKTFLLQYQKQESERPIATNPLGVSEKIAPKETPPVNSTIQKADPSWSNISSIGRLKPVLIGLGILLLFLGLFAGYTRFSKPRTDTVDSLSLNAEKQRLKDSIAEVESVQQVQDSINAVKQNSVNRPLESPKPRQYQEKQREKQWEREKKDAEKQWEKEKKDAEKAREELKKQFERIRDGKDN